MQGGGGGRETSSRDASIVVCCHGYTRDPHMINSSASRPSPGQKPTLLPEGRDVGLHPWILVPPDDHLDTGRGTRGAGRGVPKAGKTRGGVAKG